MISISRLSVIILFLNFTSCTTPPPNIAYECPEIILPHDPFVPIGSLTDKSKPDEVMKAWVATAIAYRDWNRIVRQQIDMSK